MRAPEWLSADAIEEIAVDVDDVLVRARTEVLESAYASLEAFHSTHYEAAGEPLTRQRLADLYDLVAAAIRERDLTTIEAYAESVARERFAAGFDIVEVQTAFNSLEREMWRRVAADVQPERLEEAIGLLSTVLGAGKDVLGRTYVSLAVKRHVPSLDLSALFRG